MIRAMLFALLAALAPQEAERHVVLISVDGLAAFYMNDPKAHMPTLRRLAAEGAVAEGMRCSFPTVTWPNHTTLVTGVHPGRHGVIGNSYFDRATQKTIPFIPDPLFDKDEIVKVPTLYDVAHRAGLKTAAVIWPATRNAKTLHWTLPDCKPDALFRKYSTPAWLEELRAEGIPVDMQETWCNKPGGGVQRDWMYSRATAHAIRKHKPNLVLLHLVEADHVQHAVGPKTDDAYWSCSYEDDRVRDVVDAVEAAGLRDRTVFFIVSDHGFIRYTKQILPNVQLRKAGLIRVEGDLGIRSAYSLSQGGGAFVYVLDKTMIEKTKAALKDLEGVAAMIDETGYAALGIATPAQDPRMPDLVLSAKDGYTFADKPEGDAAVIETPVKGSHGYLPSEPQMYATFIVSGAGIRRGVKLGVIDSIDVAPTAARALGLKLENVDGKVREEIFEKK